MADYGNIQTVMAQGRQLEHAQSYDKLLVQLRESEILVGVYVAVPFEMPDMLRFPFAHAVVLNDQREYDAWEQQYRTGHKIDRRFYGFTDSAVKNG